MAADDKRTYNILLVLSIIISVPCIIFSLIGVSRTESVSVPILLGVFCAIAALFAAFCYVVNGFSKQQAWAYKAFVFAYMLSVLCAIIGYITYVQDMGAVSGYVFVIIAVAIISFSKNLGRTKSLALCAVNLVLSAAMLAKELMSSDFLAPVTLHIFSNLMLSIMLGLITWAKYRDKAARGTN